MKTLICLLLVSVSCCGGLLAKTPEVALGDHISKSSTELGHFYGTEENGGIEFQTTILGEVAVANASIWRGVVTQITYSFLEAPKGLNKITLYTRLATQLKKKPKKDAPYEIVRLAEVDIVGTAGIGAVVPDCLLFLHMVSEDISYQLELKASKIDDLPSRSRLTLQVLYEKDLPKPLH